MMCIVPGCNNRADHAPAICLQHWRFIPPNLQEKIVVEKDRIEYKRLVKAAVKLIGEVTPYVEY